MEEKAPVQVLVSAKTDVGRARETNEDACSIAELETGTVIDASDADCRVELGTKGLLLALSDGMGGHQAGEVASALVLESLQNQLTKDTKGKTVEAHLDDAIQRANRDVRAAAMSSDRKGMGATLVVVFIRDTQAYIAEVGDSRGYLLRAGRLRQMTRDQSLVQLLVDQGVMTPREARNAPARNVILQAVGLDHKVRVAIGRLELRRGDRLMLCSDGITNEITDDELRQIMTDSPPRAACETMIALANERGGHDNQTVIVADVLGEALAEPVEFESVTSTFHILQAFKHSRAGRAPSAPIVQAPPPKPPPEDDDPEMELEIEMAADEESDEGVPRPVTDTDGWVTSLLGKLERDRRE